MSQPESRLSRRIIAELNRQSETFAWKNHGSEFTVAGLPDIIVCHKGLFYAFEVKLPGREGNVSATQAYIHDKIKQAGGGVFVITSIQQALERLSLT